MYALMYDSDNGTYPDDAQYIAAYVDGSVTGGNYARAKAAHPNARFWLISAVGEVDADVIDIEPTNVWPPANAVPWIRRQLDQGRTPAYYCNTSTRQQCLDAFAEAGLPELPWWRSDYRLAQHQTYGYPPASLPLGEIGWQYADPPLTGSHWDASVISEQLQAYLDGQAAAPTAASAGAVPLGPSGAGADPGFLPWDDASFNLAPGNYYGLITGPAESHGGAFAQENPPILKIQQRLQELGYAPQAPGWADGRYGQPTADAVAAWQAVNRPGTLTTRPGEIWADDWAALFSPASVPAGPAPAPTPDPDLALAPPQTAPPWPGGFGAGDYLGDIAGPAQSHGGDPSVDGPDVIACIAWVQQRLQALRWAPADPGWADGTFGQPTIVAVAAWQRERAARVAGFLLAPDGAGRIYTDDYAALQGPDNRINT
jgi:peptidoglycan hydrolase-like protein with peptidoglycan-binding domain